ncbi:hypothetical protein [Roseospirillum parvum]|uniref:Uncharacterized protein n=1 Tax=Roseospirillum parvum TaxID=83401 RepID=A0A1G8EI04_9PROT|nr:hypothetical protein [Roseospirillum parvum]SDH69440.1 hypothetical protein SAMN05421742_11045 [Roseospirillum parvum]
MSTCRVPGCTAPVTRWGSLCSTHKSRQRRHGHPQQTGVTKAELVPFVALVRQRKSRNPDSPLWGQIEARWAALVEHCRGVVAQALDGRAMNRHQRQACVEVVRIADHVEPWTVIETALALYMMQEHDHRRFQSDDAFRHQLSRRLRGLTDVNAGSWFDHGSGRVKRVYRDLPATTTLTMAAMLNEAFGLPGLMLARREEEDARKRRDEVHQLGEAVRNLT